MTIAKGDTVYLRHGEKCEYIVSAEGKHLVNILYEHGEEIIAEPQLVDAVYNSPPILIRDQQIVDLEEKIRAGWGKVHELERRQRELAAENERMLKIQSKYKGLQSLDDFMEGRIKFVVLEGQHNTIHLQTFEEALRQDENRGVFRKGMKFLTLFGTTSGDLQWRISEYSNDSGTFTVHPFHEFKPAAKFAQDWLDREAIRHLASAENYRIRQTQNVFLELEKCWPGTFTLPPEAVTYFRELEKQDLRAKKQKLLKDYEEVSALLSSLEPPT